jgi:hypothetical protein
MNLGQLLGEQKLRIWQLEDELAGMRRVITSVVTTAGTVSDRRPYSMRDGLPKRVVDLLKTSDRPLSSNEIGAALDCDLKALYQRIPLLVRTGSITRQGRRRHYIYWTPRRQEAA